MARVPMDLSIYECVLRGRRSWIIGSRNDNVFPDPVWDWMKTSLEDVSSVEVDNNAGSAARWIDVGLAMVILEDKCETMRGSNPNPENVDESVRGALLGFDVCRMRVFGSGFST